MNELEPVFHLKTGLFVLNVASRADFSLVIYCSQQDKRVRSYTMWPKVCGQHLSTKPQSLICFLVSLLPPDVGQDQEHF